MLRIFILASITALTFTGCDDNDGGRQVFDGGADGDGGADDDSDGGGGDGDGGGGADAASAAGTFDCGEETCDLDSQECCLGEGGATCVDEGTCEGPAFTCDGPEDCGDDACCADMNGGTGGTSCSPANECGGSVICAGNADCPDGEECCEPQSDMTPVSGFCANNCPGPG